MDMMEGSVHEHKFKVSQSVSFTNGIYKVTQFLPPEGDDHQYGIKKRVVKESQLDRIG